jgi:hypothetical protein
MPNWCTNSLFIRNEDKTKVDALEQQLLKKEDQQLFAALIPRPADQEENWYNWNLENWGTKWEAGIIDWERTNDNEIFVSFDSAWSPPIAFYENVTQQGWYIEAQYYEPGMGYIGQFIDGFDESYEYDISDLETIEALPEDLVEFAGLREEHEYWKEYNEEEQ